MNEIETLMFRMKGELSTRMEDRDIVDILEVLQHAQEEINRLQSEVDSCVLFDLNYKVKRGIIHPYGES